MTDTEEGRVYNPWREFIENVISGDNYFRSSEYQELLDYMDQHLTAEDTLARQLAEAREEIARLRNAVMRHEGQASIDAIHYAIAVAAKEKAEARLVEVERDAGRLDWLEENEAALVTHRETDDDEYSVWWRVVKGDKSLSGHPLGDAREAIDAAKEKGGG